jgi:hypothetical protein
MRIQLGYALNEFGLRHGVPSHDLRPMIYGHDLRPATTPPGANCRPAAVE